VFTKGLLDGVTTALETRCHRSIIGIPLVLLSGLNASRLLVRLLHSFVTTLESACKSTHRRAGRSALTGVTGDRAANRSKRGATTRTPQNMRLRGLVLLGPGGIRGGRLRPAWIKPCLFDSPGMAFVAIFILLRLALPFCRVYENILCNPRFRRQHDRKKHQNAEPKSRSMSPRFASCVLKFHRCSMSSRCKI
jgi:hypothetical protein